MRWAGLAAAALATILSVVVGLRDPRPDSESAAEEIAEVSRGELVVRTVFRGRLDSRHVVSVASAFEGSATILSLSDEGARVARGDLLVRFDTSELERELLRYDTEVAASGAELRKIVAARHPMEILELEEKIATARRSLAAESQYLADSRELAEDRLVSPAEIAEQEAKVEGLRERLTGLEARLELTRAHLHPMEVQRAEATLRAAREELARTRRQIGNGAIHAPGPGVVVHQPLHIGGEYRTVRVGDRVYANQPFLMILDFEDLLVNIAVPEAELGSVQPGNPVLVQPAAHPEIRLPGVVEQVSEIAQTLPDKPSSERYFRAVVGVGENHPRLRPGMSVVAQVVTYQASDALRIPRRAVGFAGGEATAVVLRGDRRTSRRIEIGHAGETHFEVLDGVAEGDRVLLQ